MKAKLAGIASHTGMQGVFRLLGADIFRVAAITPMRPPVQDAAAGGAQPAVGGAADLRRARRVRRPRRALRPDARLPRTRHFGVGHAMLLMLDEAAGRLYTVASTGYPRSGIGSEIAFGEGVIGVAARERAPIRIGNMTADYGYGAAIREARRRRRGRPRSPIRGSRRPRARSPCPVVSGGRLLGVLFAESAEAMRFRYEDEDALGAGRRPARQPDPARPAGRRRAAGGSGGRGRSRTGGRSWCATIRPTTASFSTTTI